MALGSLCQPHPHGGHIHHTDCTLCQIKGGSCCKDGARPYAQRSSPSKDDRFEHAFKQNTLFLLPCTPALKGQPMLIRNRFETTLCPSMFLTRQPHMPVQKWLQSFEHDITQELRDRYTPFPLCRSKYRNRRTALRRHKTEPLLRGLLLTVHKTFN